MNRNVILTGDCVEAMAAMEPDSIDAIVCDPPYGLEFMGREWDKLGGDAGMSKPGIGARDTAWPAFGGSEFGGANPTCKTCGGRARGKKRCSCDEPDWQVKGEALHDLARPKPGNLGGFATGDKPSFQRVMAHLPAMQAWHEAWAREAFRVAKPGAHLLAFGGTRTVHRLMSAIEDAGWEIRDTLVWGYATGFPKSLNVSKAIDKAAGAEREVVGYDASRARPNRTYDSGAIGNIGGTGTPSDRTDNGATITAPSTADAKKWAGWGTALKPAWEPIVMARKPLRGTVAANVLAHGTGALNIDATRIEGTEGDGHWSGDDGSDETSKPGYESGFTKGGAKKGVPASARRAAQNASYGDLSHDPGTGSGWDPTIGRWPANVILTDPIFDGGWEGVVGGADSRSSGLYEAVERGARSGPASIPLDNGPQYGDSGTYSRFFQLPQGSTIEPCQRCHVRSAEVSFVRSNEVAGSAPRLAPTAPDGRQASMNAETAGRTTSETVSASSVTESGPTTSRNHERVKPPKMPSLSDPVGSVGRPTTSSATTTITSDLLLCASCAVDVMADFIPVESSDGTGDTPAERGTYTRFLLIPKASRSDREPVTGGLPLRRAKTMEDNGGEFLNGSGNPYNQMRANVHPTVKPVDLMRHLVKLVTPPGGVVLDPFLGSGTTAIAARMEGFDYIGIEKEAAYVAIAESRLTDIETGLGGLPLRRRAGPPRKGPAEPGFFD